MCSGLESDDDPIGSFFMPTNDNGETQIENVVAGLFALWSVNVIAVRAHLVSIPELQLAHSLPQHHADLLCRI
jgi:hypothetical protein